MAENVGCLPFPIYVQGYVCIYKCSEVHPSRVSLNEVCITMHTPLSCHYYRILQNLQTLAGTLTREKWTNNSWYSDKGEVL